MLCLGVLLWPPVLRTRLLTRPRCRSTFLGNDDVLPIASSNANVSPNIIIALAVCEEAPPYEIRMLRVCNIPPHCRKYARYYNQ